MPTRLSVARMNSQVLPAVVADRIVVDRHLEADLVGAAREARLVEQLLGLLEVELVGAGRRIVEILEAGRDRRVADGAVAVHHGLDQQRAVDAVRHRLAHLEVLEVLAVEIELDKRDIVRVARAVGLEHEVRHLLQAIEIGQRHRRAIADIGRAVLEGDRARAGIGQELDDHPVDVAAGRDSSSRDCARRGRGCRAPIP